MTNNRHRVRASLPVYVPAVVAAGLSGLLVAAAGAAVPAGRAKGPVPPGGGYESAPIRIATGPDPLVDGYLDVAPDEYGAWTQPFAGGPGPNDDHYNPAGPFAVLQVAFSSGFFLFVDGQQRELLSDSPDWQGVGVPSFGSDTTLDRAITAPNVASDTSGNGVNDTLRSAFRVFGGATDLAFGLRQQVTQSGTVSVLTQDYRVTNNGTATIRFQMVRAFDGDLPWTGGANFFADDEVGTTANGGILGPYVFEQEASDPGITAVTLSIGTGRDYYGGKHGVTPAGGPPPYDFGTDTEVWDAFGIPASWRSHIAGVGYAPLNGVSGPMPAGSTSPEDGFMGLDLELVLLPGETRVFTVRHTYGQNEPMLPPREMNLDGRNFPPLGPGNQPLPVPDPLGPWHELWPNFCNNWSANQWRDNGDGRLSPCDFLFLKKAGTPIGNWFHVEEVTVTVYLEQQPMTPPELQTYMDFQGPLDGMFPLGPWHEIWPDHCKDWECIDWGDNGNGVLDECDIMIMVNGPMTKDFHVTGVATDITVVKEQPPPPITITSVVPDTGGFGDIIEIRGSGFGTDPDDLCVITMNGDVSIPLQAIEAQNDFILAEVGIVRPGAVPGPIAVALGNGDTGTYVPAFPEIQVVEPVWVWDFTGPEAMGPMFTPIPTAPVPTEKWFHSDPPQNGALCIFITNEWPQGGAQVRISARMRDHASGIGHDQLQRKIKIIPPPGGLNPLECAIRICDAIECAWSQQLGIPVICEAQPDPVGAKITLRFPPPFQIGWGNITICVTPQVVCKGDVNNDGVVDVLDLLQLLADWGPCPAPCKSDINGDGVVDVLDLLNLLADWGCRT